MPTVAVDFTYDDEWFVGEDKVLRIAVKDEAGAAVNIGGWTFAWEVRLSRYHPTIVLAKATGSGITQFGPAADGVVDVAVDKADTLALRAGTYYHGLARTNAGSWDVVAEGKAVLRKAAVHAT